jgi:alkanesulfonate monooxygenase
MHPFTAARMIASLAYVYGRRVCLNLVTGTALRDLDSLSQLLSHDDRYERLLEYAVLLQRLLAGGNVTYEGKYYQVRNLQLLPRVPAALLPRFFLAGQSDAARRVARDTGATCLHMLPPTLTASGAAGAGVNLGIITREREQEAWAAARARFPENECGQTILELSMQNTDSEWKRRLSLAAGLSNGAAPGFWLGPFRNFQADQPFFVGSHSQVAELVISLVRSGVCSFVLDVPPDEIEFENIAIAFAQARTRLAA